MTLYCDAYNAVNLAELLKVARHVIWWGEDTKSHFTILIACKNESGRDSPKGLCRS